MSDKTKEGATAAPENTRKSYEKILDDLQRNTKWYAECREKSRERWQYAEANAHDARLLDRNAAEALRACIKLIKQLAGGDCLNALRALASLDQRSGDAGGTFTAEAEASAAGPEWDPDDQVTLAELEEEGPGNGD